MEILDAQATAAALPYPELAAEIGLTLQDAIDGNVSALERATAPVGEGGTFLLMGAADRRLAIAKVGAVHPSNAARGLPTIIASVIVTDANTGELLALIDGTTVTTRRTSALSLYGAMQVGACTSSVLMVGAGVQAHGHIEALHAGLGVNELFITSRTRERAERLAQHARSLGIEAEVVTGDRTLAVAERVGTIVTTTNSLTPVLPEGLAGRLDPRATIVAVGAFRPDMAEIPPQVVSACDVVVDTLAGAKAEAGDLIQPALKGSWAWESATALEAVMAGRERGGRPVLYKTVGHSMWDLAAARLAVRPRA